jgi:hypothetical protein
MNMQQKSKGAMWKVLDIDLDFFLNHKYTGQVWSKRRLEEGFYKPWAAGDVRTFLEKNCGLDKKRRVPGMYFIHHDELFYHIRKLQEEKDFSLRFSIDHVDAHADLGTGDASYKFLAEDILHLPVKERAYPEKVTGCSSLSCGNFLSFMAACCWIESLTYINDEEEMDDCQWFNLKGFEVDGDAIQLKKFSKEQMDRIVSGNYGDMQEAALAEVPMALEPEVPFRKVDYRAFKAEGQYDLLFLTQSPGYTPASSDQLIPLIREYMDES